MSQPTVKAVRAVASTLVADVIARRAVAEVLREQVDAIKVTIIAAGSYVDDMTGEAIVSPSDDWTMCDAMFDGVYLPALDAAVREQVSNDHPEGFCPALMAENALKRAEAELILAALPLFSDGKVYTSVPGSMTPKRWKKFVDSVCSLCLA